MKYSVFERLTLATGGVAVGVTILASFRTAPIVEEIVAQILIFVVLLGAVHWGRNGGFVSAVAASLIYIVMRVPLLIEEGLVGDVVELIVIRVVAYGIIGILGGELCVRVKYVFASMEDANSLDPVTRVFNERFIADRLRKKIGEFQRYETDVSIVVFTLDPGLYLPLRKMRQRQVLRSVATHIRNDVRLVDDLGRLDDSRFLALLPHTDKAGATVAADRVRKSVRDFLGARDESVTSLVLGAAEDLDALQDFAETLTGAPADPARQPASNTPG